MKNVSGLKAKCFVWLSPKKYQSTNDTATPTVIVALVWWPIGGLYFSKNASKKKNSNIIATKVIKKKTEFESSSSSC